MHQNHLEGFKARDVVWWRCVPGSAASSTSRTKPADTTSDHRALCQQPLMGDCDVRMPKVAKVGLAAARLAAGLGCFAQRLSGFPCALAKCSAGGDFLARDGTKLRIKIPEFPFMERLIFPDQPCPALICSWVCWKWSLVQILWVQHRARPPA